MADWWDQQAPGGATPEQVTALYQELLGRAPENDQVIQSWASGIGAQGIDAVRAAISASPEAQAHKAQAVAPAPSAPAAPAGGDAALRAQIAQWASMPGADPSLGNNPDYWVGAINSRGGLNAGNTQYWQDASVGPSAFFNNPNRESSGAAPLNQIGAAPTPTSYSPPNAPNYTPYNPGPAPKAIPFVAPTLEDARNSPGFQSALESADQGIQRSAVAKSGIGGGLLKDLSAYNIGLADQNYQNVFGNALTSNEANNGQALNSYTAGANANIGAGNLNLAGTNSQFANTYNPQWQSYLSNVGQQQFGANYGLQANQQQFGQGLANRQFDLSSQNQYWGQGFQENQNAYNQYDNSQKTAFDQWYKLMQAGNPGNPYT